jgi:hypothetical protein
LTSGRPLRGGTRSARADRTQASEEVRRAKAQASGLLDRPVAVVGGGAFGTVLAVLVASKGYAVSQWVRDREQAALMQDRRENTRYLPGVPLPLNIFISTSLKDAVHDAGIVVMAVPSQAVRDVAEQVAPHLASDAVVVNVAKGIEHDTYKRMSEVLRDVLGDKRPIVALSGPNHAEEIGRGMPGATVVGGAPRPGGGGGPGGPAPPGGGRGGEELAPMHASRVTWNTPYSAVVTNITIWVVTFLDGAFIVADSYPAHYGLATPDLERGLTVAHERTAGSVSEAACRPGTSNRSSPGALSRSERGTKYRPCSVLTGERGPSGVSVVVFAVNTGPG